MGLLERLATLPVEQGHQSRFPHVRNANRSAPFVGGDGAGGFVHHNVAAQPVNLVLGANVGNQFQNGIGDNHTGQALLAGDDAFPLRLLIGSPIIHKVVGGGFKRHPPTHHFPAFRRRKHPVNFHGQPEAVK